VIRGARRVGLIAVCVLWWPLSAAAQRPADSSRTPALSQSIEALVARLPGRPVVLATLVTMSLRDGFSAQLALENRRLAEGTALYEGRILDPEVRLTSGLGGPSRRIGEVGANEAETSMGVAGALPWGTVLSGDFARGSTVGSGTGVTSSSAPTRLSLNVSQPLLDGVNQRAVPWRAAQLERTAAGFQLSRVRQEIATDIELQYWLLAEAQATEAVYARSLELAQEILTRNAELAARDLIAAVDVLTVRSGVALRESFYAQARQARYDQSDALLFAAYGAQAATLVQSDTLPALAIDDAELLDVIPDVATAVRTAVANRTDLRASRSQRDAAQLRVAQARNGLLPGLSLDGGWTSLRNGANALSADGRALGTWRVGVSMGAPVLNRSDRGLSQRAMAQVNIETIQVSSREAQIVREVRETVRALRWGRLRWNSATQAAALAWEQLIAERRRLELGMGDSFRLLQTEEIAVQAQLEAVRARYDLLRAFARYQLSVGLTRMVP